MGSVLACLLKLKAQKKTLYFRLIPLLLEAVVAISRTGSTCLEKCVLMRIGFREKDGDQNFCFRAETELLLRILFSGDYHLRRFCFQKKFEAKSGRQGSGPHPLHPTPGLQMTNQVQLGQMRTRSRKGQFLSEYELHAIPKKIMIGVP